MNEDAFKLPTLHRRIAEKTADRGEPPVLIVAIGDSVTQGVTGYNEIAHEQVYHARLRRGLQDRFPLTTFSVLNAGVDGQTAADGLRRFDRDVIRHDPDLVLIAFALNDAVVRGRDELSAYRDDLESMIDTARQQTRADIVLLTPNRMAVRDNDKVPAVYRDYVELITAAQNDGTLDAFADAMRDLGASQNVPVADVYHAWCDLEASGVDTTAMLSNGLNHPTPEAHRIAAERLLALIDATQPETAHRVDHH